ncbi:phytoene desaturase family protein [Candidatus Micrarchaeota archaeon]|nr:phytoene desaturase family protein [Candidatus Micrarchaeota archaeon]
MVKAGGKIAVVGAGPGGLSCAMLLASRGFDVTVFEKEGEVGGRNAPIHKGGFTFDTGPTFLMMRYILDEIFALSGRKSDDYLKFTRLEPMYRLVFHDGAEFFPTTDRAKMGSEIARAFPGEEGGLARFYSKEKKRLEMLAPCLQKDYSNFSAFVRPTFIAAIPYLFTNNSLYENLGNYFRAERLRLCFTFQAKYLGMSPWECPGVFTMIPYVEHEYGIYHVEGGLNMISKAMAKVFEEHGGKLRLGFPIKRLVLAGKAARGVELENGEKLLFDEVVINADFAHAMTHLVEPKALGRYSEANLRKKRYSCSTFMLYLGLDKKYDFTHHSIFLAEDYRANIDDISVRKRLSEDFSFYIQNASATDPTLAPKGKSTIYVLVPVPNNTSGIDWKKEADAFRNRVLDAVEARTPIKDIRKHIEAEHMITPADWESGHGVFLGATFNLAHNLTQMLYFRPHNRFEELENCYLVGGGTHPGSGLPTIYESGRITAELILKKYRLSQATGP